MIKSHDTKSPKTTFQVHTSLSLPFQRFKLSRVNLPSIFFNSWWTRTFQWCCDDRVQPRWRWGSPSCPKATYSAFSSLVVTSLWNAHKIVTRPLWRRFSQDGISDRRDTTIYGLGVNPPKLTINWPLNLVWWYTKRELNCSSTNRLVSKGIKVQSTKPTC